MANKLQKLKQAISNLDQRIQENYGSRNKFNKAMGFENVNPDVVWDSGSLNGWFQKRRHIMRNGYKTLRWRPRPGEQVLGKDQYGRNIVKSFKIRTVYDMMRVDYPHLYDDQFVTSINKNDAPLLSTTTGAYAAVHGANAFHQIIQEDNALRLLPKVPYIRGGYRGITAAGTTNGVGVEENAAIPDSVKPTLQNIDYGIKENAYAFNVSARQEFLSMLEDDTWAQGGSAFNALRNFAQLEFNKVLNRELLTNVTTPASDNLERIDAAVSSNAEVSNCGDVDANDADIYGLDRDSSSAWHDAYVNHNGNTDRNLTPSLIKDVLENVQPNWGGPQDGTQPGNYQNKVWLTGYDTKNVIEQLFEQQNTYRNNGMRVQVGVNGVQTLPMGARAGMLVNMLYGIPLFVSDDVPADTISRLYLLDLNHMKLGMGIPTMYFQGGFSKGTAIELDQFQDKGVYYQMSELLVTRFNVHGKLRDLQ